jgi:hypothetical protein
LLAVQLYLTPDGIPALSSAFAILTGEVEKQTAKTLSLAIEESSFFSFGIRTETDSIYSPCLAVFLMVYCCTCPQLQSCVVERITGGRFLPPSV